MPSFSLVDCLRLFCAIFERQTAYQRIVRKKMVFLPFLSSLLREEAGTFHNFSETKNRERCFRPGWAPPGSRLRSLFFACTHAGAHHRSPLSSFFAQTRAQQTGWRGGGMGGKMARGAGCPSARLFGTGGPTSENQPLSLHHHHRTTKRGICQMLLCCSSLCTIQIYLF